MLFGDGFWRNMMALQLDLVNAGVLPMGLSLIRLLDFWVCNRLPPRELGLLPSTFNLRSVLSLGMLPAGEKREANEDDEAGRLV